MPSVRHTLKRRNGQLQACERCRKAKIRCDHESPRCGRCAHRNLKCLYHPAPATKAPPLADSAPETSKQWSQDDFPLQLGEEPVNNRPTLYDSAHTTSRVTNFSTIFSESRSSFVKNIMDVVEDDETIQAGTAVGLTPTELQGGTMAVQLQNGINILQEFPTRGTCEILLEELPHILDIWLSPVMIQTCLAQVWLDYDQQLDQPRTSSKLAEMTTNICRNGQHPISVNSTTSWHNWFGGSRIRWEMLSIMFSFFGRAFKHREAWDSIFSLPEQKGMNPKTAAEKMAECAQMCIEMNDEAKVNELVVCALKNYWKLRSNILSDNSDGLVKGNGIVIAAVTTTFLHRIPQATKVTPLSEYRSSLSSSIYYLDKCSSLFSGRPPLLTKQYCHCPLPLDLSEDDLYHGSDKLVSARSKLDQKGWNTNGEIHTITWVRALCLLSPVKEKILEISLGVNVKCTKAIIDNLKGDIENVVRSYPLHIQYHNIQHWSQSLAKGRSGRELYIVARIQLDVLRCKFLVQRLNVSRCHDSGQELLDLAQEILAIVLSLWLHRDYLQNFNYALNWLAVCYGIPCAGLLCIEIRRLFNPIIADSPLPLHFSKSEVIHSLMTYVTFLEWIRPTDGNAELCWKLRNVIKRILDNALDLPAVTAAPNIVDTMDFIDIDDADDLNWLNTIDWTQGDWLDTNEPFL